MRGKSEQFEIGRKQIEEQAKELVEVYGWDADYIETKKKELIGRAQREINSFGDEKDLSNCWNLLIWITSGFRTRLDYNFDGLREEQQWNYTTIAEKVIDAFRHIPNLQLKQINVQAEMHEYNGEETPCFIIKFNDEEVWYRYSLLEMENQDALKLTKKIYTNWRNRNND